MWTATSAWTCRPRRTRWCPRWETATTAAPSSGCSATWPWASDPSSYLFPPPLSSRPALGPPSPPRAPSPGGSSCTSHASPLCQTGQRPMVFPLRSRRRLFVRPAIRFQAAATAALYGDLSVQVERRVASAHGQHRNQSLSPVSQLLAPPCPLCRSVCCLAGGQMIKQKCIPNCWKVFLCSSLYCKWPWFSFWTV